MLSNQESAQLSNILLFLTQLQTPAAQPHAAALAELLSAHAAKRAAITGRPSGTARKAGAKPVALFQVSLGDQWATTVQGARAAHELVTETLKSHAGSGAPPSLNSMQVMLSRTGMWWRLLVTDAGQHALEVRRVEAPAPE
jgi:hypothetical protein